MWSKKFVKAISILHVRKITSKIILRKAYVQRENERQAGKLWREKASKKQRNNNIDH